ncbi:MAG TPA: DHA2 family efflux MFS transporter permease subunit [Steroidobacteraceae bacterium]|jgi:DHA2 family multidrug resistance protein|nr:DHA2 family efflux MFS transporter permease subunit [Steroidobacteraceae bacterium]
MAEGAAGSKGRGGAYAEHGWTPERSVAGKRNPWSIVAVISIATFMTVLDSSIVNVALDHIAGNLSASYDEATWVTTTFLIAQAIVIPISGWLANVVGRKRYYMISVTLFTAASFLCGIAPNLTLLILARVLQGAAGGGLAAVEQSMLVDTFPPSQRGKAFAAYGMVVIVGPILGPILGGWLTDNTSWRWCFLINVPVGALSLYLVGMLVDEPAALVRERAALLRRGLRVDVAGFALVALFFGCLEFTLDRGQTDDWFSNPIILATAVTAAVALLLLIPWELTHAEPIVPIAMFGRRNFGIASIFLLLTGTILFGTTLFIPQLLQVVMGYTAMEAGLALTAGGAATILVMPLIGALSGKVDARLMIAVGLGAQVLALLYMSHFNTDLTFGNAAFGRMIQSVGLPFLFVPISVVAYVGLAPNESNQASAMMNVARNLGGTIGISTVQTLLTRREQLFQSRMVTTLNPLNPNYTVGLNQIIHGLTARGQSAANASAAATAALYQTVQRQAMMLSFIDIFYILMIVVIVAIPLLLLLQKPGGAAGRAAAAEHAA